MLKNKKKFILAISVIILTFSITSSFAKTNKSPSMEELASHAAVLNSNSNRYSKPEKYLQVNNRLNLDGFTKIMEDNKLEIWHKDKNASIRIVDKKSGYIWGGLPYEKPEDMNTTWSGIGNSLLSIDYFDKKGIEKRLSIADKTVNKKYIIDGNKLKYSVNYSQLGISFDFQMELKDGKLTFSIYNDSIKEGSDNHLAAIYFVPFLGSTRADEIDGYIFVPDGAGALIRFNKPSKYLINFDKRVYGKDYGIDKLYEVNDLKSSRPNDFTVEEPSILMPVFGVVHGVKQNAIFATIKDGVEYASITASPSGMLTNYNWVSAKFIYRQKYLQPTSRNGAGVQVVQENRNNFNAEITYDFLNGDNADYVGMAKIYRDTLKKEGILSKKEKIDDNIPLQIDIVASDIEKSFLYNKILKITSIDEIKNIVDKLNKYKINNTTIVLQGWQKGGIGGYKPSSFEFESKLGGKDNFRDLDEYIKSKGGRLYYYENPVTVNETQIDLRKEGGNSLSQALIMLERDNNDIWFKNTYFVESNLVADYISKKADQYSLNNMNSMAINEVGSKLYAENQQNHVTTRSDAYKKFQQALNKVLNTIKDLALYNPNQYLWKFVNDIFNTPMINSQYLFESDTVPFLQIVLKGSIDYYGPYSNMSFYSKMDALKLVEYGAYPSFIITGKKNTDLKYTTISELYSTNFEDWQENIIDIYNYVNKALSKVEGKMIINRTVLTSGVVKVDYEDNISIIVNYTEKDYKIGDTLVPNEDYAVIEGE